MASAAIREHQHPGKDEGEELANSNLEDGLSLFGAGGGHCGGNWRARPLLEKATRAISDKKKKFLKGN